jgi:mannose-6-phosphate isomerase-like protein (cupin superfamily)
MNYTIKNLRDTEDMAPKFGFDAVQEARFAGRDLDAEKTGVALMRVKPGQRQAFAHRHDAAEEIYVILTGSGRIKLDEEITDVHPLDAIRIAPGVARALEAGPDGLEYLAFGPHHEGDGEILKEDFWA